MDVAWHWVIALWLGKDLTYYDDVMKSQITGHSTVSLTAYAGAYQIYNNVRIAEPLWGEIIGDRWIPHTKGVEKASVWWRHHVALVFLQCHWISPAEYRSIGDNVNPQRLKQNDTVCISLWNTVSIQKYSVVYFKGNWAMFMCIRGRYMAL